MSMIQVSNLTFAYEGSYDNIFEDVSFQLDTDWKLGFTGRNGRGKTTFLNLLMGKYSYSGSISSSAAFDYFPFEVQDREETPLEIAEHLAPEALQWQIQRELSLLEVDEGVMYRPFSTLSNGEQTKVLLALLFLREGRFLLIDEPTNHLDMNAREIVGNYLNSKKGFILVSHDRAFLDRCVDHILSINRTNIEVQRGNYSSWKQNKDRQDQFEQVESDRLRRDIKQLTEAARRAAQWSDKTEKSKKGEGAKGASGLRPDRGFVGHKAAKMMKRSKSIQARREDAVEEKSSLLKNLETAEALAIHPLQYHSGRLAEVSGLTVEYDGRQVFRDLSFTVERGDRVALRGRNGCGKSTILKLLAGCLGIPHTGTVRLGSGLDLSYVPQDTSFLRGSMRDYTEQEQLDESLFKAILRKMDFSRVQFEKDLSDLSGGQKKKVLLAGSLCRQAHLYLWDEPLNFVDVLSRIQIEELILAGNPTMIFVEHDRAFQENIATKVLEFAD